MDGMYVEMGLTVPGRLVLASLSTLRTARVRSTYLIIFSLVPEF